MPINIRSINPFTGVHPCTKFAIRACHIDLPLHILFQNEQLTTDIGYLMIIITDHIYPSMYELFVNRTEHRYETDIHSSSLSMKLFEWYRVPSGWNEPCQILLQLHKRRSYLASTKNNSSLNLVKLITIIMTMKQTDMQRYSIPLLKKKHYFNYSPDIVIFIRC